MGRRLWRVVYHAMCVRIVDRGTSRRAMAVAFARDDGGGGDAGDAFAFARDGDEDVGLVKTYADDGDEDDDPYSLVSRNI